MNSSAPEIPVQPIPFEYDLPNLARAIGASGIVKIVALGSSSTAGEGGITAYPLRLEAFLREEYANQRIEVLNRGVGGEEAPKELERMDRDVIAEKPNLVIWQIGTNAVWQGRRIIRHPMRKLLWRFAKASTAFVVKALSISS